jgi:hypothetical protein
VLGAAVLLLSVLAAADPAQTPLVEWRELAVPGVCMLRIAVPQGWEAEFRSPAPGAVNLRLAPQGGSRGEILITGLAPRGDASLRSTGDIKRAARRMGEEMLGDSVEKRVELERLNGADGSGFFYSLTDKRSPLPEGHFRHMTQGIMAVGPLRLAVTVLAESADSAAKAAAFELMRTAECSPPPAVPER